MSIPNQTTDRLDFNETESAGLPSSLNVLTILTIIGSAIFNLILGLWGFIKADESYKRVLDAQGKMEDAPAWAKRFMGPEMLEMLRKQADNKLPLLLLNLLGGILCIWGAMEMRKLKKQGFMLWVAGEFLPIFSGLIFVGSAMFAGFSMIGLIFPVVFLILYFVQRKYLIY